MYVYREGKEEERRVISVILASVTQRMDTEAKICNTIFLGLNKGAIMLSSVWTPCIAEMLSRLGQKMDIHNFAVLGH